MWRDSGEERGQCGGVVVRRGQRDSGKERDIVV